MKKWIACTAMAITVPLCGQNLLKNSGFEAAQAYPWIFWPKNQIVTGKMPASGKQCLEIILHGQQQLVIQRPIPVKGGYVYEVKMKMRQENVIAPVDVSMNFKDKNGKILKTELALHALPYRKDWTEYSGIVIAPEAAQNAEFTMTAPVGSGSVFLDDISLTAQSRLLGNFGNLKVSEIPEGVQLQTHNELVIGLERNRNYAVNNIAVGKNQQITYAMLFLNQKKGIAVNEYYSGMMTKGIDLNTDESRNSLIVKEKWPLANILRTIELYDKASYFRITYEIEATRDFHCARVCMNIGFPARMRLIAWKPEGREQYYKWQKPCWFSLIRPDQIRCITYLDAAGKAGIALIGADAASWKELPANLLSSAGPNGGFTLELNKWNDKEIRKGDKISFDLFFLPTNSFSEAEPVAIQLSSGF